MEQAEEYRQLADFVRRVRHDASNALTAALGNVQLLLEDARDLDGELLETLRLVEAELRRLSTILRRLNQVDAAAPPPVYTPDAQA